MRNLILLLFTAFNLISCAKSDLAELEKEIKEVVKSESMIGKIWADQEDPYWTIEFHEDRVFEERDGGTAINRSCTGALYYYPRIWTDNYVLFDEDWWFELRGDTVLEHWGGDIYTFKVVINHNCDNPIYDED